MTTKNNVTQNTQTSQSFDALKTMRISTIKEASALLSDVREIKKKIYNINQAIEQKQKFFAEQIKVAEKKEKVVDEVKAAKEEVSKSVESNAPEFKQTVETEKAKSSVNIEITRVEPLIAQPQKDQKVFIDEKGNKIVRKFITDRFPQKTPSGTPQRGNFGSQNRPQGQGQRKPYDPNKPRQQFDRNKNFQAKDGDNALARTGAQKQSKPKPFGDMPVIQKEQQGKSFGNKNKTPEKSESKKQMSTKALLKKGYIAQGNISEFDSEFVTRKLKSKKQETKQETIKIEKAVVNTQDVQIKVLSEKIGIPAAEIIKQLFKEGIVKTINDAVDFDYAAIIASNFGVE